MTRSDDRSTGGTEQPAVSPCVDEFLGNDGGLYRNLWRNREIRPILRVENALNSAEPPEGLGDLINQNEHEK